MKLSSFTGIKDWIKLHYDKVIAVILLVALAFSLLYLAFKIGMTRKEQEQHARMIERLTPRHPDAERFDRTPFQSALSELNNPFQIPAWTNALFVPKSRVWCVDCRMPIPWEDVVCPFCSADQPQPRELDPTYDSDGDGIPDLWELKFGLDPNDPADAFEDMDGDGFSNIMEFRADPQTDLTDLSKKHGTDMTDPTDYPALENLLVVQEIEGEPFDLRFLGKNRMPDGSLRFQLNVRGAERTVWARMGDTIEGFTLVDFEPKTVKRRERGVMMTIDESILTLKRGEKHIPLVLNQLVPYTEYTATLEFTLDDSTYTVTPDATFTLKEKEYRVKEIDNRADVVVIVRLSDGKQFDVHKAPARLPREAEAGQAPSSATSDF